MVGPQRTSRRRVRAARFPSARPGIVATVAHDLRAPLSALETAAEALARDFDELGDLDRRKLLSTMHRRIIGMRAFVENLLTDATLRDGRLRVSPTLVDLRQIVAEACEYVAPLLAQKDQRLTMRIDSALIVPADQHRISQVLVNLLSNANKYADRGSIIEVALTRAEYAARVTVSDQGPGVPAAALARIFDAYERGGRRDGGGFGMGLWIVRSIVRAHGGTVGAENREGRGARFWFELPIVASATDETPRALPFMASATEHSAQLGEIAISRAG